MDSLEKTNLMKMYFGEKVSVFDYLYDLTYWGWNWIIPLWRDIWKISLKYDKSILAYFQTFRFLHSFALFSFILFLILIVVHLSIFQYDYSEFCSRFIPCFLLYSRFHTKIGWVYALTYIIFISFGVFFALSKWVSFDILHWW